MERSHKHQIASQNEASSSPRDRKKSIWLSKWRLRSGKQTSDKGGTPQRPRSNPSGVAANGQAAPSSGSSSASSSSSSFQQTRRQRQSSPSCDLSSGYLSQTNGSAQTRRPNRSEPSAAAAVVAVARNHGDGQTDLHCVAPRGERLAKINSIQHSHSIASSSTLTRLPMVPMKIDDEDEFVLAADENNVDAEFNDGQNLAMHVDEHDLGGSTLYLDQHPGYLVMIDGMKRRQHHRQQLRQLQQQQHFQQLQVFRQQHQYQQHSQRQHRAAHQQRQQQQFGDKLEAAMQFGDNLEHHQHPLRSRLANDELAGVSDECADSDQTLASNHRYRFATFNNDNLHHTHHHHHQHNINDNNNNNNSNNINDHLTHLAGLDYVLAASQNSATPDAYDDQQLDEGDEFGQDCEQLASLAPDLRYNHQLLLLGALGVNHQQAAKLNWLQPADISSVQLRIPRSSSGGVVGNRNLPHPELAKRASSNRPAPPIRSAQDANGERKSLSVSNQQQGYLLQAMSQNYHQTGARHHNQLGQQQHSSKLNHAGSHHNHLDRAVSSRLQPNLNQGTAPRLAPKSASSSSLLFGDSKGQTRGAAMMRTTSQMNVSSGAAATQNSNTGSHSHHGHGSTLSPRPAAPMSCCGRLAKFLLFIANVLFWCTGVALGAWGILALVEDHKYNLSQLLVFEPTSRMSLFQLLSWSFITLGGATILVGICGCSALFKNSRWILGLYIFLILAIFALDLATGLLAIIFQERLVTNVRLRLVSKMRNEYGIQASFTAAIDYIQTHFECCGLEGHFDYEQSLWRLQRLGGFEATVARTCCHLRNTLDDQAHVNPRPVNESMCQSTDVRFHQSYRFRRGCLDDLERLIRYKIWTFTVGCGIIGAIILVVLTLATCFCRSIPNKSKKETDRKKNNKLSSRNNNPGRTHQQELMYNETVSKKQGHHRHGPHDHR